MQQCLISHSIPCFQFLEDLKTKVNSCILSAALANYHFKPVNSRTNSLLNGCMSSVDPDEGLACLSWLVLSNITLSHQVLLRDVKYLFWKSQVSHH